MARRVITATDASERAALRDEAELLRRCAHPGVAEVVSFDDDDDTATLILELPGEATLDQVPPTTVRAASALVAALADIVGDLHGIGIAGLGIDATTVVVGSDGRPFLSRLAGARARVDPQAYAADLTALAALIDELSGALAPGRSSRVFGALSAQARDDDLNARALAHAAAELAAAPGEAGWVAAPSGRIAAIALVVLALGTAVALTSSRSSAAPAAKGSTTTRPTIASADAPVVARQGDRYVIGVAGDRAIVGDWDCRGERVALLRPSTGDIFVFQQWAALDAPVTTTALTTVPGARAIETRTGKECSQLVAVTESGDRAIRTEG